MMTKQNFILPQNNKMTKQNFILPQKMNMTQGTIFANSF